MQALAGREEFLVISDGVCVVVGPVEDSDVAHGCGSLGRETQGGGGGEG